MIFGIIAGIVAMILAIFKFFIDCIKSAIGFVLGKFKFIVDLVKRDNEKILNIKSYIKEKKRFLKFNNEL